PQREAFALAIHTSAFNAHQAIVSTATQAYHNLPYAYTLSFSLPPPSTPPPAAQDPQSESSPLSYAELAVPDLPKQQEGPRYARSLEDFMFSVELALDHLLRVQYQYQERHSQRESPEAHSPPESPSPVSITLSILAAFGFIHISLYAMQVLWSIWCYFLASLRALLSWGRSRMHGRTAADLRADSQACGRGPVDEHTDNTCAQGVPLEEVDVPLIPAPNLAAHEIPIPPQQPQPPQIRPHRQVRIYQYIPRRRRPAAVVGIDLLDVD
ncbi:hypothetical protein H0H93_015553, partial [Arthromyces matolae]